MPGLTLSGLPPYPHPSLSTAFAQTQERQQTRSQWTTQSVHPHENQIKSRNASSCSQQDVTRVFLSPDSVSITREAVLYQDTRPSSVCRNALQQKPVFREGLRAAPTRTLALLSSLGWKEANMLHLVH